MDIKCTTKSGKVIGIELQVQRDTTMKSRAIFSNAKSIAQQLGKRDSYSKIKEVITIVISVEHIIFEGFNDYKYEFLYYNPKHKMALSDLSKILFLEFQRIPENLKLEEQLD